MVDNFSIVTPGTTLAEVDAAVFTNGALRDVSAVHVEIYSSAAAAAGSLTGDVYDDDIKLSDLTYTVPYGIKGSALAQIAVSVKLGVGKYYLAVIPTLDFASTGAEIGVYASSFGGDGNAFQVNPGGGLGIGSSPPIGGDAAYRILAQPAVVPEPSSLALCGIAGLVGLACRRARRGRPAGRAPDPRARARPVDPRLVRRSAGRARGLGGGDRAGSVRVRSRTRGGGR